MRRSSLTTLLILALAAPATAARADNPFYVTGKLGVTEVDARLGDAFPQILDGDDNSAALGIGLRLGRHLAFQAEYHDLGEVPAIGSPCSDPEVLCIALAVPLEADSSAISVTVLPHLPLTERLSLYGKVGFISWDTDVSEVTDAGSRFIDEFNDEELVYGAGLRLQLPGPFGLFAEYERLADSFDTAAIGATFGF